MALDEAARLVADQLNGRTVATAESCTAGRLGSSLAAVENAVDFYRGTLVAYQEEIKRSLLAVRADSVFSQEAAEQMAIGVCELLGADAAVATTGVVGSEPQDGVPPGTVFVATAVDGAVSGGRHRFDGDPDEICEQASERALRDLAAALARVAA